MEEDQTTARRPGDQGRLLRQLRGRLSGLLVVTGIAFLVLLNGPFPIIGAVSMVAGALIAAIQAEPKLGSNVGPLASGIDSTHVSVVPTVETADASQT